MQQVWADRYSGGDRSPPRAAAVAVLLLSLVALGIVAVLESRLYLNHDVAWYIQAARQIGFGNCRLYVECFLEPNPPLILWISALVVGAGNLIGLDPVTGFRGFVAAVSLGVGALLYRTFSQFLRQDRSWPLALAAAYVAIASVSAVTHFGQRDHLIALLIAPYLASQMLVHRQERVRWASAGAIASGILAGIAVALKPHYLLAIAACEAWATVRGRPVRSLLRAELVALGAAGAAYLAAVSLFAPDYFRFIEIVRDAYASYRLPTVALVWWPKVLAVSVVPAVALLLSRPSGQHDNPAFPFALASAAGAAAYFVQQTGFAYQEIPVRTFGAFAVLYAVVWRAPSAESRRIRPAFGAACVAMLLALQASIAHAAFGRAATTPTGADVGRQNVVTWVVDTLRKHARGGRVGFIATSVPPASPAILYSGNVLANRMPALWLLPALVNPSPDHTRRVDAERLRTLLFGSLREDFVLDPPAVIVEQHGRVQAISARNFSPMQFLSADPHLDALFRQYREVERASFGQLHYAVYVRPDVLYVGQRQEMVR